MAAPVKTDVRLPDDSGNTGKRVQTQSEVIGGNTVHAHYFIPRTRRKQVSRWTAVSTLQSVQASAQTNNTGGFFWIQLPSGGAVRCRIRRLQIAITSVLELDYLTAPRIAATRFSFTGTAAGATLAQSKVANTTPTGDTADAAPVAQIRTAITGMTCTYEAGYLWAAMVPTLLLTTSGLAFAYSMRQFEPNDEDDYWDFGPGEGIVLWQPDAGTASDGRRFVVNFMADEYDNA